MDYDGMGPWAPMGAASLQTVVRSGVRVYVVGGVRGSLPRQIKNTVHIEARASGLP